MNLVQVFFILIIIIRTKRNKHRTSHATKPDKDERASFDRGQHYH